MNPKTVKLFAKIIAVVLTAALVLSTFSFLSIWGGRNVVYGATGDEYLDRQFTILRQTITDVQMKYKDEVMLEQLVEGAFSGVLQALDDPYSVYYTTEEATAFMQSVNGQFSGIGVRLENFPGGCRITEPIPGSPAEKAGVQAGDQIIRVDDQDVAQVDVAKVAERLQGDPGTDVRLTVLRKGATLNFKITRAIIESASVESKLLEKHIGYIRILQFDNDTQLEFKAARLQLLNQGATRFVVDLRDNPGGYISGAADIAGQFMPAGAITHLMRRGEIVETVSASGEAYRNIPIALLVNHGTASASEILAGAWQDSKTAKLVGATTYGKGVAQQVYPLANGGYVKLSEYYFLTPNKNTINRVGLTPDYPVVNPAENEIAALVKRYSQFAPMNEPRKPRAGDLGLNVYGAQQRLELLGYHLQANARMDAATVTAVKAFQKSAGLHPYGALDYSTMAALDRTIADQLLTLKPGDDLQMKKAVELLN